MARPTRPTAPNSEPIARAALQALLTAPLDGEWTLAGRHLTVTAKPAQADTRLVALRWDNGALDLTLKIYATQIPRTSKPEDTGHNLGVGIFADNVELVWSRLEWAIRDALRAGEPRAALTAANTFFQRTGDDEARNRTHSEAARRIAAAIGLGDAPEVICGTYDLTARTWSPDPKEVLRRSLLVAFIKAHFHTKARAALRGSPFFKNDPALPTTPVIDLAPPSPSTPPDPIAFTPLRLDPALVRARLTDFIAPPGVLERCCAALNSGKNLLLLGPPGTGKSTLAKALADQAHADDACGGPPLLATASADWSTYDTIGGWTQRSDSRLVFREGVVTRALRERRWILLDEVNRADIDKCFGELFTVLSGGTVTTAYTRLDGETERPVEIGPDTEPYAFGPHIRLVATMNVRDKASLFRLSYAFMRRFAAVHVPALDDAALLQLAERDGERLGLPKPAWTLAARALSRKEGFGAIVELGPALLRDVLTYVAQRPTAALERAVAEAIELLVFPQLEGAEDHHALPTDNLIDTLFTDPDVRRELHASLATYVPALQGRWPR
jgi:MoxR-like ATPase